MPTDLSTRTTHRRLGGGYAPEITSDPNATANALMANSVNSALDETSAMLGDLAAKQSRYKSKLDLERVRNIQNDFLGQAETIMTDTHANDPGVWQEQIEALYPEYDAQIHNLQLAPETAAFVADQSKGWKQALEHRVQMNHLKYQREQDRKVLENALERAVLAEDTDTYLGLLEEFKGVLEPGDYETFKEDLPYKIQIVQADRIKGQIASVQSISRIEDIQSDLSNPKELPLIPGEVRATLIGAADSQLNQIRREQGIVAANVLKESRGNNVWLSDAELTQRYDSDSIEGMSEADMVNYGRIRDEELGTLEYQNLMGQASLSESYSDLEIMSFQIDKKNSNGTYRYFDHLSVRQRRELRDNVRGRMGSLEKAKEAGKKAGYMELKSYQDSGFILPVDRIRQYEKKGILTHAQRVELEHRNTEVGRRQQSYKTDIATPEYKRLMDEAEKKLAGSTEVAYETYTEFLEEVASTPGLRTAQARADIMNVAFSARAIDAADGSLDAKGMDILDSDVELTGGAIKHMNQFFQKMRQYADALHYTTGFADNMIAAEREIADLYQRYEGEMPPEEAIKAVKDRNLQRMVNGAALRDLQGAK